MLIFKYAACFRFAMLGSVLNGSDGAFEGDIIA
jgi:hypothetical protein